jgi:hypothetical protein
MKSRFVFHYEMAGKGKAGRGTLSSCGVDEVTFVIYYLSLEILNPFDEAYEKNFEKAIDGDNKQWISEGKSLYVLVLLCWYHGTHITWICTSYFMRML